MCGGTINTDCRRARSCEEWAKPSGRVAAPKGILHGDDPRAAPVLVDHGQLLARLLEVS